MAASLDGPICIELDRPRSDHDWEALAEAWRALEVCSDASFFQSWSWIGCQSRQRFTNPLLIRAMAGGRVVGLALFNRTGPKLLPTLHLHEAGRRGADSVFIEHNGPLLARGHTDLARPMLAAARRHGRLRLSGVGDAVRDAAGQCHMLATRPAPFVHLAGSDEAAWLGGLGRSTRYQLRRSRRGYEARGRLIARRAVDAAEARLVLAELARLHQARWTGRGKPGAFAEPDFVAFHQALVARALPRGEVELWRMSAGEVIGCLYNFRWRDRIYAYQAGFDYAGAGPHQQPGLTCHHLAIATALAEGCTVYDFLAGEARYKTSLGGGQLHLHWLELAGTSLAWRLAAPGLALLRRARAWVSRARSPRHLEDIP